MSTQALSKAGYSALGWTLVATSTLVIGLRVFVRVRLRIFCTEDYLMLVAWGCLVAATALFQDALDFLFPNGTLDPARVYDKTNIEAAMLYLNVAFGKASVGLLLLRLIGHTSRWQRRVIITSLVVLPVTSALAVACGLIPPCGPLGAGTSQLPDNVCMGLVVWALFALIGNLYSAILDVLYSVLATVIISKLRFGRKKKACLIVLLSLGYVTALLSLLRIVGAFFYDAKAKTYVNAIVVCIESNLVIICGSLATLAPIFEAWRTGKPLAPRRSQPASLTPDGRQREPSAFQYPRRRPRGGSSGSGASSDDIGSWHARYVSSEELMFPPPKNRASNDASSESIFEMRPLSAG